MKPFELIRGICAAAAGILLSAAAIAAEAPLQIAKQAVETALNLGDSGDWSAAQRVLREAQQGCLATRTGSQCRTLVEFSLGYVAASQAHEGDGTEPSLLEEAKQHYLSVLKDAPDHIPTLQNLALVCRRLNDISTLETALKAAVALDSDAQPEAALLLGELYVEQQHPELAVEAYRQAIEGNPANAPLREALIEAYGELPVSRMAELAKMLPAWETQLPDVAEHGYAVVIASTYASQPRLAEDALLHWVQLTSARGSISLVAVKTAWPGWNSSPVADLKAYLAAPDAQLFANNWWKYDDRRRNALTSAALALGRAALESKKGPAAALSIWSNGQQIAPEWHSYMYEPLAKEPFARLQLLTAIANLLAGDNGLDPGGRGLNAAMEDLFAGKLMAYQARDLRAIQQHHTVLGLIYAKQGVWRSSDGIRNARFQLESAIRTAQGRTTAELDYYQPQADLKALLAKGYLELAAVEGACRTYLAAAEAYLDVDDLAGAQSALEAADPLVAEKFQDRKYADIKTVYDDLRRIVEVKEHLVESVAAGRIPESNMQVKWLFDQAPNKYHENFLRRQRFKVLADVATRIPDQNLRGKQYYASRALGTALDKLKVLVGSADLVRLEQVKQIALTGASVNRRQTQVSLERQAPRSDGKRWTVFLPSLDLPYFASFSNDALVAARVAIKLYQEKLIESGWPEDWTVNAGTVTFSDEAKIGADGYRSLAGLEEVRKLTVQKSDGSVDSYK